MGYSRDLANAARRHFNAATRLDDAGAKSHERHRGVAGYLYGLAGECALKEIMRNSGMCTLQAAERGEDPFYAHFPGLKTLLRNTATGRRAGELRRYAEDSSLMNEWSTDMRYAPNKDIQDTHVDRWRGHARILLEKMECP